ncbi:MAG: lysylphosphatidylglycerol synthase domain-containing protein [Acidobacteriaceae bacterium]
MKRRRGFFLAVSFALSGLLIFVLIKVGKIHLGVTLAHLRNVSASAFALLVALTALHIYLSSVKWRKIDIFLRSGSDSAPSAFASFAFTSVGVVCGQILPVQISMSAARTLGTYFYGSALKRGTAGSLFEQSFDVWIMGFLAVASGVTWLAGGGAVVYLISAFVMTAVAIFAVGPIIQVAHWVVRSTARSRWAQRRIVRRIGELERSGFLHAGLGRQLMLLSAMRFAVQIWMLNEVTVAVGAHIPVWQVAAATPLATLAYALALTPGGIGVTELGYAFALNLFGTRVPVAAQWALEARILVFGSCLLAAGIGVIVLVIERVMRQRVARDRGGVI